MSKPEEPDLSSLLDFSDFIPTKATLDSAPEISMMITQAQKANLRAMGFDEQVISLMKPEEAHKLFGLKAPK